MVLPAIDDEGIRIADSSGNELLLLVILEAFGNASLVSFAKVIPVCPVGAAVASSPPLTFLTRKVELHLAVGCICFGPSPDGLSSCHTDNSTACETH